MILNDDSRFWKEVNLTGYNNPDCKDSMLIRKRSASEPHRRIPGIYVLKVSDGGNTVTVEGSIEAILDAISRADQECGAYDQECGKYKKE
jgi:hypothetical protein